MPSGAARSDIGLALGGCALKVPQHDLCGGGVPGATRKVHRGIARVRGVALIRAYRGGSARGEETLVDRPVRPRTDLVPSAEVDGHQRRQVARDHDDVG